ncbi:MarR family transcriptional regulator [Kutzneria viridogrisea]|uniref:HTH marR-type domain-containing protein n=2 Tax=Kutzneria TaxID=43356 RepID=W5W311_9PSEU|nr:MarR family transcriptional regulator [Kutzneria albida]AHH95155.1 hypothetical protein KALB_1784 [Kutzneria albida DSM 43870]MBA8927487.1 DNA-binding MarR family transcriptional regulator [Kutzneria viridogrisea]
MRNEACTDQLAGRLLLAVNGISHRLRVLAGPDELTPTRLVTLATLGEHGRSRIGDLAERVGIAAPTMSRLVDWLAVHGLLTRSPDPADQRVSNVELSEAGESLLARVRDQRTGYLAERIRDLSPEQVASLVHALAVLEDFAQGKPSQLREEAQP